MRQKKETLVIVFLMICLTIASIRYTVSFPLQQNDCLVCHTNPSGISLSCNDSLEILPNTTFSIYVNATGNSGSTMAVKFPSGVDNNSLFDFGDLPGGLVNDNDAVDLNTNLFEINIIYSVKSPEIPGIYTLRVFACQSSQFGVNASIQVIIFDDPPIVESTTDKYLEYGSINQSIEWYAFDSNPDSYVIYENNSLLTSVSWNGENVSINIDTLQVAVINYTIVFFDTTGQFSRDSLFVHIVDTTSPSINHPSDRTMHLDQTGESVSWSGYDLRPKMYELSIDGIIIDDGEWNTTSMVFILPLIGLELGIHNCSITLFDKSQNSVTDIVIVTVVENRTPPIVDLSLPVIMISTTAAIGLVIGYIFIRKGASSIEV